MLDKMRKHSRSFIIYIFFGIIIAVFVVNFGPQSSGCVAETSHAGEIDGEPITISDLSYALAIAGLRDRALNEQQMQYLNAIVMDRYLVRELLANEAISAGLRVANKEIDDMLLRGRYLALGRPEAMIRGEGDRFDYDLFSRYVRYNWSTTVKRFKEEQRRELLAEKMRLILRGAITASAKEVEADYLQRNTQVQLQYVRFAPSDYRDRIKIDQTRIDAFIAANGEAIKAHYERNKDAYSGLPAQLLVRLIELRFGRSSERDAARSKALRLQLRLEGGEPFAKVARESDHSSATVDGLLGWRHADKPGIGKQTDPVLTKLEQGKASELLEEEDRFVIVQVEGRRQGNVTLADAKAEIALEMLRNEGAVDEARDEAARYIARVKAGETLTALFGSAESKDDAEGQDAGDTKEPAAEEASSRDPKLKLSTTSLFARSPEHLVPGIGVSEQLSRTVFSLQKGQLIDEPAAAGAMIYLVSVLDRKDPDMEDWNKRRDDLIEEFENKKWEEELSALSRSLCEAAVKDERLFVDPTVLMPPSSASPKEAPKAPPYIPCRTLQTAFL